MNSKIKTFHEDDKKVGCLICGVTYHNGKPQWIKGCLCGNISFFDITPEYIRFSVKWGFVFENLDYDWKVNVLKQIEYSGKPLNFENIPGKDVVDYFLK